MSDFELIESTTQWRGAVFSAGIETFRYAGDLRVSREKVWHPGAVGILPVDDAHVWLTRQPREAAGLAASLEIPAGKRDVEGEPPEVTAARELVEETGLEAGRLQLMGRFHNSPGFSDELSWCFLATELTAVPDGRHGIEEQYMTVERHPLPKALELIRAGEITDAKTIIGLYWAQSLLS